MYSIALAYRVLFPVFLVLWIGVFTFGAYKAGAARGRGGAGLVLGLILGPIGVCLALFLPAVRQE